MMRRSLKLAASAALGFFIFFASCASAPGGAQGAELERIVVRRALANASEPGVTTSVLTQEEIQNLPANSVEDLLTYCGVDLQSRGPYAVKSDVALNGSTFQQVLILVNGARVNDAQTAHHNLDLFFDTKDIERIEIIPASASAKYGPDGIGGAINFVLKRPARRKSSFSAAGGERSTTEEKLDLSYQAGPLQNRLSIAIAESNGWRYDTDFRTDTFFHSLSLEGERMDITLDAGYNEKEFGAFDFYTPGRGFPSKEWINTAFVDLRGVIKSESVLLEPRVNFRRHHDKFMLTIENPDLYLNHHRSDNLLVGTIITLPWGDGSRGVVGLDWGYEAITSNNLGKHAREHWDLYLDPTWQWGPDTSLNVTLRVDDYSTSGTDITGGVTLRHAFGDRQSAYITAGRTMRLPTFTELYYSDPTTAGDPNLKSEKALSAQAGWSKDFGADVHLDLSAFVRRENDTIDFTKQTPAEARFIARNISRALSAGVQTYGRWQVSEEWFLDLRYAYVHKQQDDNGLIYKYGLNYLKHLVTLGIQVRWSRFHNRTEVVFKKKPNRRGWTLVNDRFAWDLSRDWEVFCEVENLFNVEFQEIEGIPQPGRIAKFGLKYSW